MIKIQGIPETISVETLDRVLAELGIDVKELVSFAIDHHGVRAVVYALNENGQRYIQPGSEDLATHTIEIRLDVPATYWRSR